MSDYPCPACGQALPADAFVCRACTGKARTRLRDLADFLAWSDDKRARRGTNWRFGTIGRSPEVPLPYDPRVTKAVEPLTNWLIGWGRVIEDEAGQVWPADPVALVLWLRERLTWIAGQEWALDFVQGVESAHAKLERLFDNPPDREAIGRCGADLPDGSACPEVMAAEKGAVQHECPRCGALHDVKARREEMLGQAADLTVTTAEAVRLLRVDGKDVDRRMIQALIRHVPIRSVGWRDETDVKGRKRRADVYPLGALRDGLALMERDDEARRAVKRAMRGGRDLGGGRMRASEVQCS